MVLPMVRRMIIFSDHAEMVAKEMELEISMHGQDVWRAKSLSRESNQDSLVWEHIMSSHIADRRGGKALWGGYTIRMIDWIQSA